MRHLIIVTVTGPADTYQLWSKAVEVWDRKRLRTGRGFLKVLRMDINGQGQATMLLEGSSDLKRIAKWIDKQIDDVADEENELFVAAHRDTYRKLESPDQQYVHVAKLSHQKDESPYREIKEFLLDSSPKSFREACRAISGKEQQSLAQRLGALKHRLSHFFLPVEVDLRGWQESGFEENYWNEIQEAYDDVTSRMDDDAKTVMYGGGDEPREGNVRAIVEEAGMTSSPEWREVQQLFPQSGGGTDSFRSVQQVLENIEEGDRESVKKDIRNESSIRTWFAKLEEKMDALRTEMEEATSSKRTA